MATGARAEFEPWPFYLTAWEEDKHVVGQANIELDEERPHRQRAQRGSKGGRVHSRATQGHRVRRRFAEAACFGGRLADSVPRKRRREPRVDGIEHATPVGAAAPC